jgi:hypothetical protein
MEVFVHLDGTTEVKRHRVELVDTTGTLIRQFGDKNSQVWLRSATEPLAADDFLIEFGVMENDHLHICSCRHIKVQVRHGADVKDAEFSPAATVSSLVSWAAGPQGFNLAPAGQGQILRVCGTRVVPEPETHLGSLAKDCVLCIELDQDESC